MDEDKRSQKSGRNKRGKDDEFQWKKASKTGLIWIVILIAALFFTQLWPGQEETTVQISYSEYLKILQDDNMRSGEIIVKDNILIGETKEPLSYTSESGKQYYKFKTILPYLDDSVVEEWRSRGVDVEFVTPSNEWTVILLNSLPWILILVIWIIIARKMQGGGGGNRGIFSFGKSRAKWSQKTKQK